MFRHDTTADTDEKSTDESPPPDQIHISTADARDDQVSVTDETETDHEFSIDESLLPDDLVCNDTVVAEEETLPSEVLDGLTLALETVGAIVDEESIIGEHELTVTEVFESVGDQESLALDFQESDQDDSSESTEVLDSGTDQAQQLITVEQGQESSELANDVDGEQSQLFDPQEVTPETEDEVESTEVTLEDLQSISEDAWAEQEQVTLEFCDTLSDLTDSQYDELGAEESSQETFDQLIGDFQAALDQQEALEEDQQTHEEQTESLEEVEDLEEEELLQTLESLEVSTSESVECVSTAPTQVIQHGNTEQHLDSEQEESLHDSTFDDVTSSDFDDSDTTESPFDAFLSTNLIGDELSTHDSAYFSPTESISLHLFSDLSFLESSFEPSVDEGLSSSQSGVSVPVHDDEESIIDPDPEFDLSSLHDSSELSIVEELPEEADLLHVANSPPLSDHEESLEMVSQHPTLPDPPPYDFLQDLEEQEEANRRVSPTRKFLLWSLKRTRQIQDRASYDFTFQNLPVVRSQSNHHTQDSSPGVSDSQKSDKTTRTRKKYPWDDRPRSNAQHLHKETESATPPLQPGIYNLFAYHLKVLRKGSTATRLDSAIRTQNEQLEILDAIYHGEWRRANNFMRQLIHKYQIKLDPYLVEKIHGEIRKECRITPILEPLRTRIVIVSLTSWREQGRGGSSEIIIKTINPANRTLDSINPPSEPIPFDQNTFSDHIFQNLALWEQEVSKLSIQEEAKEKYPPLPQNVFKTKYDCPKALEFNPPPNLSSEEQFFRLEKKLLREGIEIKAKLHYDWWKNSTDLVHHTDYNTFESIEIRFSIEKVVETMNKGISNKIKGKITVPIRKSLFEDIRATKPYEYVLEDILCQDGVKEGLLSMMGEYQKGDLLIARRQVKTISLDKVPKNISLNTEKYGTPDNAPYRKPDIIILTHQIVNGRKKIGIITIDVKRDWKDFNHSPTDVGRGRGQPLRDVRWFILEMMKNYPNLEEDDFEISCYTLTGHMKDGSTYIIEGEELIGQVPASSVYPFSGRNCKYDFQVYNLVKRIYDSLK